MSTPSGPVPNVEQPQPFRVRYQPPSAPNTSEDVPLPEAADASGDTQHPVTPSSDRGHTPPTYDTGHNDTGHNDTEMASEPAEITAAFEKLAAAEKSPMNDKAKKAIFSIALIGLLFALSPWIISTVLDMP